MNNVALVDVICREVTESMTDYMTPGVMSSAERARFELHLHACTWCMTYYRQLAQTAHGMRSLAAQPTAAALTGSEDALLGHFRRWVQSANTTPAVTHAPPATNAAALASPVPVLVCQGPFFKFLARGATGPVSNFKWPVPAAEAAADWVEVPGPLELCARGIHACRGQQLAHWLDDELWLVELAGELREGVHASLAARGRLVRQVGGWNESTAARFALAAYEHAEQLAAQDPQAGALVVPHLATRAYHLPRGNTALAAFCAAMAVARMSGRDHFDQAAYDGERVWQSEWLVAELGLNA